MGLGWSTHEPPHPSFTPPSAATSSRSPGLLRPEEPECLPGPRATSETAVRSVETARHAADHHSTGHTRATY